MSQSVKLWLKRFPAVVRVKRSVYKALGWDRQTPHPHVPFRAHYDDFRATRLRKLEQLLGRDWFPGKRILEVGAGRGHVGEHLLTLGANVTLAEARPEHIAAIRLRLPGVRAIQLDNDLPWRLKESFDLIVHWGLLYHLDHWRVDLLCALNHAPLVSLETEVCDSSDPAVEVKIDEPDSYDQAFHGRGSRPSAAMIEKFLTDYGCAFTRHDDADLNTQGYSFDWKETESGAFRLGPWPDGHYELPRRFYMIRKEE